MKNMPEDIFKPEGVMPAVGRSVLIVTANGVEDTEFFYPYYRFIEEGFKVEVSTPEGGEFRGKNGSGLKKTRKIAETNPVQFDLLYVPGGKAPERLKREEAAVNLVRKFAATGKPIAAVCHGPQLLAAAGVLKGRKVTGWPEIERELTQAEATYVNQETVTDAQFITARWPGDLPAHVAKTLEALKKSSSQTTSNRSAA